MIYTGKEVSAMADYGQVWGQNEQFLESLWDTFH
jgi:hypothetical protein